MPVMLNFLERLGIMRLNRGPAPLADLLGQLGCKAVLAGLNLGVFHYLSEKSGRIDEVARSLGADPAGLNLLFRSLQSLGYLEYRRERWSLSAMSKKWMRPDSPHAIAPLFYYFNDVSARMDYLHETIRAGRPPMLGYEWLDEHKAAWDYYHAGLQSAARLVSRELFKKISLSKTARRLLDLGGGHGQFCVEFCKKHSSLAGVVYDWPQAEAVATDTIASSGLSDRIVFRAGDFVKDDLGTDYDVILMFNIIRIFMPEELKRLFSRVRAALNKGGMAIVMDHLGHVPRSRFMRANAFLILLELYNSTKGQTHASGDIMKWLGDCGFSKMRGHHLRRSPGLGVVVAVKA
jgi:hypothetical protein